MLFPLPAMPTKSAGPPEEFPPRGPVARAIKAARVDEGLGQYHGVAEARLPIGGETSRIERQDSGCQIGQAPAG